jgi:hypothetical protein
MTNIFIKNTFKINRTFTKRPMIIKFTIIIRKMNMFS